MEQRGIFLSSNNQYLPANTPSKDTEQHSTLNRCLAELSSFVFPVWLSSDQASQLVNIENVPGGVEEIEDWTRRYNLGFPTQSCPDW